MENELIRLVQLPVIEEQLKAVKTEVERQVEQAQALVCTEETLTTVRATRAALNKKFAELEERRKAVKKAVLEPYERFETVYRECVANAFVKGDNVLRTKINDTENAIKSRCEEQMRDYFTDLCAAEHVEFLRFEQVGLKIGLADAKSKSANKCREQIAIFVTGVSESVHAISRMENAEELMVEFKKHLDLARAIADVQERHRRIEEEKAAQEALKAAQEREAEAVAKVEALAPPVVVEEPVDAEKEYQCVFTVNTTLTKLKKLKNYMDMEGIKYE